MADASVNEVSADAALLRDHPTTVAGLMYARMLADRTALEIIRFIVDEPNASPAAKFHKIAIIAKAGARREEGEAGPSQCC